jgi:hypothetical protein
MVARNVDQREVTPMHGIGWRRQLTPRPSLWLFFLLFSLYLMTAGGEFFTSDGVAMYRTTQALVEQGQLVVAPDQNLPQLVAGWDGQFYSMYDLGQPILAIPFYLLGAFLATLLPNSDYAAATRFCVSVVPQVSTALAAVVLFQLSLALFRRQQVALVLSLLWATGTLAWPYAKFFFSEALLTLFLLLACCLLAQGSASPSKRKVLLAGLMFGLALAIRVSALIYSLAFLAYFACESLRFANSQWTIGPLLHKSSLFFSGTLLFLGLFCWHNYVRFHTLWATGYQGQAFSTPLYVGLYGLLLSSGRSLFLYSPLALLGLACWPRFRQHFPALAGWIATAFLTALFFFSTWWTWHGGWSWGPRFLVPLIPFLLLPLGAHMNTPRFFLILALVWLISLWVVLPGVSVDFNDYIINSIAGSYANENRLWFYPWQSPIVGHWHYWLAGRSLSLIGYYRVSDLMGLPINNRLYFALTGGGFLVSLLLLSLSCLKFNRQTITGD